MDNRRKAIELIIDNIEFLESRGADSAEESAWDRGAAFGYRNALRAFGIRRTDKHAYRDGDNVYTYDKETRKVTKERRPE